VHVDDHAEPGVHESSSHPREVVRVLLVVGALLRLEPAPARAEADGRPSEITHDVDVVIGDDRPPVRLPDHVAAAQEHLAVARVDERAAVGADDVRRVIRVGDRRGAADRDEGGEERRQG